MASHNSSEAIPDATLGKNPVPYHQQNSWLYGDAEHDPNAIFAAEVMDIARGTRTIAGILQSYLVDLGAIDSGASTVRPLLSENDMESLARLALVVLDKLADTASTKVDSFNRASREGEKA